MEKSSEVRQALETIDVLQSMICLSAERLEGLRTQCSTTAEITQQEIRTLEGKLVKLFSRQLVARRRIPTKYLPVEYESLPSVQLWLTVVGLGPGLIKALIQTSSLDALKDLPDPDLKYLLSTCNAGSEESRRLTKALSNLKRCTDAVRTQDECFSSSSSDLSDLSWDSWDMNKVVLASPRMPRTARGSVPSEDHRPVLVNQNSVDHHCSTTPCTPVKINSPGFSLADYSPSNSSVFSPGSISPDVSTPPGTPSETTTRKNGLLPDMFPLIKSKSHESQLGNRVECGSEGNLVRLEALPKPRPRLPTEPGPGSTSQMFNKLSQSPPHSNQLEDSSLQLLVPPSPRTPTLARSMGHVISHRFTKMFKVSTCDYCSRQVFIGLKCKECKYKCHKDCEARVPPSCGLPKEYVDEFIRSLNDDEPVNTSSPVNPGRRNMRNRNMVPVVKGDSSNSSCNSSAPGSPAVTGSSTPLQGLFSFPDPKKLGRSSPALVNYSVLDDPTSTIKSNDSDRTYASGSTDSDKTLAIRVDSQDSNMSDSEDKPSTDRYSDRRQNSLSNKEWDIPYNELKLGKKIGTGHFGTVYAGQWHGDVAIKVQVLDMNSYLDNEKTLEQFKLEVGIFRKTRHENLVLFMGACMKPPRLAIVTSLCKGMTLYTHLHTRKEKFHLNKSVLIAQQISQGMSYLHSRGIIHKDLKSKNVFLESGKVVITDFGLFSLSKLCNYVGSLHTCHSLSIPPGWLPYLAPEVMKSLKPSQLSDSEFPFSKASDIYAFGTIWYELITCDWPYKGLCPETIIWQVGSGIRQALSSSVFSREVKEILLNCWAAHPPDRPDFSKLFQSLEKLPKKRLARSPSYPVHFSKYMSDQY